MASTEVEVVQPNKKGLASKWQDTKNFCWNPETGHFLGRTAASWSKIGIFYLIYYGLLAAFFAMMLAIFFVTVDYNYPRRTGWDSLIKNNPGMGFRPMPDYESTLIRFEQGKPSSYKVYTDHIQAFLDQYENENQDSENAIDCTNKVEKDPEKVCIFNLDVLGSECTWQKDYGYDEGTPCILFKMNKVYGWTPEAFTNDTLPDIVRKNHDPNFVSLSCEGENPADRENLGTVEFWPKGGFNKIFFPYLNQQGYRQPIVMGKFWNATNGVAIQVWCKFWAGNVYHHRNDMAASVHFELMID